MLLFIFPSLPTSPSPSPFNPGRMPQTGLRLASRFGIAMHGSDILLECSRECARLSRDCHDEKVAATLFEVSAR
ncbi:MAG: hypothetical protein WA677_05855, partial [Bradyrhizobium sp.]